MTEEQINELTGRCLTTSLDGVLLDDLNGKIVYANDRFLDIFEISSDQLQFIDFEDLTAPEFREMLQYMHFLRVTGKSVPDLVEFKGLKSDGSTIWLEASVSNLDNKGRNLFLTVIRDITSRRELLERQIRKTILSTSRSIFQGTIGKMEAIQALPAGEELSDPADLQRDLLTLRNEFDFISRKRTLRIDRVDIGFLLMKIRPVARMLSGNKVKCRFVIEAGIKDTLADSKELKMAILNIITNSLESMSDGGELFLQAGTGQMFTKSIKESPSYKFLPCVKIEIRDTGCGMNDELILRIFEPFFTTKNREQHKGLGLTEVLNGISAMNGDISVSSTEGQGSTFAISLPMV